MMKNQMFLLMGAAVVAALGCVADGEMESSSTESLSEVSAALSTVGFSGVVTNEQGAPIQGATVVINGVTRTTNAAGKYFYSVLSSVKGYNISITKAGFAPAAEFYSASRIGSVHALQAAYVKQINPTQDNIVTSNSGASVTIKANSLVDNNGAVINTPVKISIATYAPLRMPGDFTAVNTAGSQVALESVGAVSISATLASTGAPLQLKAGATADAYVPVPAEIGSMPPCVLNQPAAASAMPSDAIIPMCRMAMWRFDTATGKWKERPVTMKPTASGTTFTLKGVNVGSPNNDGLGIWNADIEHYNPACTIVEFVGIPEECYNPTNAEIQLGITLNVQLPGSLGPLVPSDRTVTSNLPFVALYNIRPNLIQEVGIEFPEGAPAYCAANLQIDSTPPPAPSYPLLTADGGLTRFNSGPPWGGTGHPTAPGTTNLITWQNMLDNQHPCGSHVQFLYVP